MSYLINSDMAEKIFNTIKMAALVWIGLCLIALGLIFIPVPVVPGIILVILGASILTRGIEKFPVWMQELNIKRLKKDFIVNKNRIIKMITSWS